MMAQDLLIIRYPTRGARQVVQRQARRLPNGLREGMDELSRIYKEELEGHSAEGETRRLKRGWRVRRIGAGGRARNIVYNTQKYLGLVLRGRGPIPQPSQPARTKPLVFRVKGATVFAMRVKGVAPNPFHRTAARAARRRTHGVMRKALVRTLRV